MRQFLRGRGRWFELAQLRASLDGEDLLILEQLASRPRAPLTAGEEIPGDELEGRLSTLREQGLLEKAGDRWLAGPRGLELLAARAGVSTRAFARAMGMPVRREGGRWVPDLRRLLRTRKHDGVVRAFFLSLAWVGRELARLGLRPSGLAVWDDAPALVRWFQDGQGRWKLFAPDGYGEYLAPEGVHPFFLEVDREESRGRLLQKFRTLASYRTVYMREQGGKPFPPFLVITQGKERRVGTVLEVAGSAGLGVMVARLDLVGTRGPWAPIWHDMQGGVGYLWPCFAEARPERSLLRHPWRDFWRKR